MKRIKIPDYMNIELIKWNSDPEKIDFIVSVTLQ